MLECPQNSPYYTVLLIVLLLLESLQRRRIIKENFRSILIMSETLRHYLANVT